MKGKALFLFTISIGLVAFAAVQTWVADTQKAKVQFIAKGPFGKVNGHFSGFKSEIIFDENNLSSSSIRASVDVKTIETGIGLRNKDLSEKEEWFDAPKFPEITIRSEKIEKLSSGYKLTGTITMKGVTKPVLIAFSFTKTATGGDFTGQFTINRADFGVGKSGGMVANDVSIELDIPVTK